jgi:hypothetical protein
MGSSDEEIFQSDISSADLHKCKLFHDCMLKNCTFYKTGKSLGVPEHISKKMNEMYSDWKNGQVITYGGNYPNVVSAYALLLDGADEGEMKDAGYTEPEIEKAILFTKYQNADMLVASICKKIGLVANTVKRLRRMYRESCEISKVNDDKFPISISCKEC